MKKELSAEELVKIEKDYNEMQRTVPMIIDDYQGFVPANYNDELSFFTQNHICTQQRNLTDELKHELSKWQLTKFEMLMLLCYQGNLSAVFDNGDPFSSPYPIDEMCKALDTVLIKAPICTDTPLYRQHRKNDVVELLCCAQHNRSYVAQPIMLASDSDIRCA